MKEQLRSIEERAKTELEKVIDLKQLEEIRVRYLGKKGELTGILKQMGKLSAEERPVIGQLANTVRADIEKMISDKQAGIKSAQAEQKLAAERLDVTLPGKTPKVGRPHPLEERESCCWEQRRQ